MKSRSQKFNLSFKSPPTSEFKQASVIQISYDIEKENIGEIWVEEKSMPRQSCCLRMHEYANCLDHHHLRFPVEIYLHL